MSACVSLQHVSLGEHYLGNLGNYFCFACRFSHSSSSFLKSILRFTILCLPMLTQAVMDSLRKAPIPGDRFPQTFHTIFSKSMHFLCLKYPYTIIHELTPKLMPYFFCGWDTDWAHTLDGSYAVCIVCFCNLAVSGPTLMLGDRVWLAVDVPGHPKGVGWGWGQDWL